ncbi:Metalloendoproteinase 1 [Morus notabilis]|uniref:Metalloendoproteinase 1 n=1 Tax=Morus notabilis TaxID=981085 RepID=W9QHU8_9ROSA|nr:Metalloendoproteinase 1 [Morus notabilis]
MESFLKAQRGSHVNGISELKTYLHRFGYLLPENANFSDAFDATFESAILHFQSKLGLSLSGKLDFDTMSQISAPRCGVPDTISTFTLHGTRHYMYFPGKPRWARRMPMKLTYAFSPDYTIRYLSSSEIKAVFKRAFARWASVIPVSFVETEDYVYADIKIGFYHGEHGDSEPFDGVLGVLAHSFSPENGKVHLDAAETWAVDFRSEKSAVAMDLESVATHEIGHLLGLAHSSVKEAVMYPTLKPREKKLDLQLDDIEGVQALYGSNPNFNIGSLSESDISTNQAVNVLRKISVATGRPLAAKCNSTGRPVEYIPVARCGRAELFRKLKQLAASARNFVKNLYF